MDRAQTYFHGEFDATALPAGKLHANSHRTDVRLLEVLFPVLLVSSPF
jgi:hypothetical protein